METLTVLLSLIGGIAIPALILSHRQRVFAARLARLRPHGAQLSYEAHVRVGHPSLPAKRWIPALLFVTENQVLAYTRRGDESPLFVCWSEEIRGFWRPQKYHEGLNTIEIHSGAGRWSRLEVRLYRSQMATLVRALKQLATDDLVRAYRQRRPYIFQPPTYAQRATQDIHGAWTLGTPFYLYLTPAHLVFLDAQDTVQQLIPLRQIQNIRVLRRLDADGGLLAFTQADTQQETAIALADESLWGQALATAARRTLEEPLTRKLKGKADDFADDTLADDDDDADWNDPPSLEALVWGRQRRE